MNISTIQKRKFLNNIYKLFYSSGKTPLDSDIRRVFNQYFSTNQLGEPIRLDYAALEAVDTTDVTLLNELMINSILNLEVLYDCVFENNEEIFSVVNTINNRLENLRAKRKQLESKIDQLLFANSNTDGFFYSFLENFSTSSNIDMSLTTAYLDLTNNIATLPKITSEFSNQSINQSIYATNAKMSVSYNGQSVVSSIKIDNFDLVFDGLNDTFWNYDYSAEAPGIVAITIELPIPGNYSISKVQGSLMSKSPCSIFMRAVPRTGSQAEIIKTKSSNEDFNRFSFLIPAQSYSSIILTIYKNEPDSIVRSASAPYLYSFGIRELVVGAEYYDTIASVVSNPISIQTSDNSALSISSVSLDVDHQVAPGTRINYYVAVDQPGASDISAFSWIPIEPMDMHTSSEVKGVNLITSPISQRIISRGDIEIYDYLLIDLNSDSTNENQLNPIVIPFSEKTVYRVANLEAGTTYTRPYLISNIDCYNHYNTIDSSDTGLQLYRSLDRWTTLVKDSTNLSVTKDIYRKTDALINVTMNSPSSGFLETKLLVENPVKTTQLITKSRSDFDLAIYLNGSLIADIPSGQIESKVEWDFVEGVNNIAVCYDKNFNSYITINLMVNRRLSDFGIIFIDYFTYLSPIDFKRLAEPTSPTFTIDTIYGSKQILASKEITDRTILRYYSNITNPITSVRYRADLSRGSNPLDSPSLNNLRIKFRHIDI